MGEKGKTAGAAIGRYLAAIVALILLGGGIAAIRSYVSSHSRLFAKADYKNLDPLVASGEALPVGTWGQISVRWVPGSFPWEENTQSSFGVKFDAGTSYFYLAVLDNLQSIAIQVSDQTEIERLEQLTEDFWTVDNMETPRSQPFSGKLEKLSNRQVKEYYESALNELGYLDADSPVDVQYILLNTTVIPMQNYLLYVGIAALVAATVVAVLWAVKWRKREAVPAGADMQDALSADDESPADQEAASLDVFQAAESTDTERETVWTDAAPDAAEPDIFPADDQTAAEPEDTAAEPADREDAP